MDTEHDSSPHAHRRLLAVCGRLSRLQQLFLIECVWLCERLPNEYASPIERALWSYLETGPMDEQEITWRLREAIKELRQALARVDSTIEAD